MENPHGLIKTVFEIDHESVEEETEFKRGRIAGRSDLARAGGSVRDI